MPGGPRTDGRIPYNVALSKEERDLLMKAAEREARRYQGRMPMADYIRKYALDAARRELGEEGR